MRVLVLEDSDDDAVLVLAALRRGGLDVEARRVESEAEYRSALEEEWDVVISDYAMPSFDGLRALRILRDDDEQTPFIMVSGTIGEELAVEAMRAGINDYVLKQNLTRLPGAVAREVANRESQRQSARVFQRTDARWRAIVNQLPAVSWTVTKELRVDWVHGSSVLENMGVDPQTLVGLDVHILLADADKTSEAYAAHLDALNGEARQYRYERNDRTFESTVRPLREDGEVVGVIGLSMDVSERVDMERQLRATQRLESIGRLAGGIAHDFNNLLHIISTTGQLAQDDLPPKTQLHDDFQAVIDAADRGANLVSQLLAFGRRQSLTVTDLDLTKTIESFRPVLSRALGDGIELWLRCESRAVIRADQGQLEQVLLNLAVNAHDAMSGAGDLTIETADVTLAAGEVEELSAGDYVLLRVVDTGGGMDAPTAERAFEPFFSTKSDSGGTGLGLATVYGIVMQSGGAIRVRSSVGEGAAFEIFLPRSVAQSEATSSSVAPTLASTGQGETILVVDDDAGVLSVASRVLRRGGYKVREANSGQEALDLYEADPEQFTLVLTDVVMPRMNGLELVQKLREKHQPRCLFMSGHVGEASMADAVPMVNKPFAPATLLSAIKQVLDEDQVARLTRTSSGEG